MSKGFGSIGGREGEREEQSGWRVRRRKVGVHLVLVDGRSVRLRALLLPLIRRERER